MAVRYLDEHEERCKFCKGDCEIEGMSGSIICHGFVAKTNADRIRSMTDEELANFYFDFFFPQCPYCECDPGKPCPEHNDCKICLLEWLKQKAEGGE